MRGLTRSLPKFPDLSTSSICHSLLSSLDDDLLKQKEKDNHEVGATNTNTCTYNEQDDTTHHDDDTPSPLPLQLEWPALVTEEIVSQLHNYICKILEMYRVVSYHNREHAYHVFTSAHKLLDLVLCEYDYTNSIVSNTPIKKKNRSTYGLKSDPLIQLAFLFSALVHDVDHTGVSNRQLVLECDELAIMYNDQSVAEQRSLAIAFSLLMKKDYQMLREVMFREGDYMKFRKIVIDLVLCTDIASPERVQIVKSKWKEAFGDKRNNASRNEFPPTASRGRHSTGQPDYSGRQRQNGGVRDKGIVTRHVPMMGSRPKAKKGEVVIAADSNDDDLLTELPSLFTQAESLSPAHARPTMLNSNRSFTTSERKTRNAWKFMRADEAESRDPGRKSLLKYFLSHRSSMRSGLLKGFKSSNKQLNHRPSSEINVLDVSENESVPVMEPKKKSTRSFRLRKSSMEMNVPDVSENGSVLVMEPKKKSARSFRLKKSSMEMNVPDVSENGSVPVMEPKKKSARSFRCRKSAKVLLNNKDIITVPEDDVLHSLRTTKQPQELKQEQQKPAHKPAEKGEGWGTAAAKVKAAKAEAAKAEAAKVKATSRAAAQKLDMKVLLNEYSEELSIGSERSLSVDGTIGTIKKSKYTYYDREAKTLTGEKAPPRTSLTHSTSERVKGVNYYNAVSGNKFIASTPAAPQPCRKEESNEEPAEGKTDSIKKDKKDIDTSSMHSRKRRGRGIKMHRRFTEPPNPLMDKKKFHFRLGIRLALDLTGNQIDAYKEVSKRKLENDPDKPDEMKVIVVLEQLMKAADVAANMQGWETMVAWCKRLFHEQKVSTVMHF